MAFAGMLLVYVPDTVEVTLTRMVQVEFTGMVALLSVTDDAPLTAVTRAELPQFIKDGEAGFARITLAGN